MFLNERFTEQYRTDRNNHYDTKQY